MKDLSIETYHNIANIGNWANSLKSVKKWHEILKALLKPLGQADYVYNIAFQHDKNNVYHEAISFSGFLGFSSVLIGHFQHV